MNQTVTGAPGATQNEWQAWIGRQETTRESIAAERVAALAATLGAHRTPQSGDPLPPGWHWIFFNPFAPRQQLGADGHPERGGFLPPVALPRRMWAGGSLTYHRPPRVGTDAVRTSLIRKIEVKSGRSGKLVFVTLSHRIDCDGVRCIDEEQELVFREAATAAPIGTVGASAASAAAGPATAVHAVIEDALWSEEIRPDPVLLFRYSALTSNGHRIHYDQRYAREQEGYPDLVVHGPLIATLLQGFAAQCAQRAVRAFQFRSTTPLFVTSAFMLSARRTADAGLELWACGPDGVAMRATAQLSAEADFDARHDRGITGDTL